MTLTPSDHRLARELASQLAGLRKDVDGLKNSKPGLAYSAIEGGRIEDHDPQGNLRGVIGTQFDGTHTVTSISGPTPPTPTAPLCDGGAGSLKARWNGVFLNDAGVADETVISPMDFARVEVHASQDSLFSAESGETLVGTIETPRGGDVTSLFPSGVWFVRLVARSQSGKSSVPGPVTRVEVASPVDADAIQAKLDSAVDVANNADQASKDAKAAAQDARDYASSVSQTAADAKSASDAAAAKADQASKDAANAAGLVAGKGKVIVQPSAPTGANADANNLWINTTNGANTPNRWDGSQWVAVTDKAASDAAAAAASAQQKATDANAAATAAKQRADDAYNAAQSASAQAGQAQTAANGKSTVYYLSAAPGSMANRAGDVAFVYGSMGQTVGMYIGQGGTSWSQQAIQGTLLANLDAGTITTGFLAAARIAAHTIGVQQLVVADTTNLFPQPNFAKPDALQWLVASGGGGAWTVGVADSTYGTAATAQKTGTNALYGPAPDQPIPVTPGDWWRISTDVRVSGDAASNIQQRVYFYDATGKNNNLQAGTAVSVAKSDATWKTVGGKIQVPSGAVTMLPRFTSYDGTTGQTYTISNAKATRAMDARVIVDGEVTTNALAANAVTAAKADFNSFVADSGFVGALTAKILNVTTLTGQTIQTMAQANRGLRLDGPNNTFTAWDQNGAKAWVLDGNTGSQTILGSGSLSLLGGGSILAQASNTSTSTYQQGAVTTSLANRVRTYKDGSQFIQPGVYFDFPASSGTGQGTGSPASTNDANSPHIGITLNTFGGVEVASAVAPNYANDANNQKLNARSRLFTNSSTANMMSRVYDPNDDPYGDGVSGGQFSMVSTSYGAVVQLISDDINKQYVAARLSTDKMTVDVPVDSQPRIASFTASGPQASNGGEQPISAVFKADPNNTTNNNFAVANGSGNLTIQPGRYAISLYCDAGQDMGNPIASITNYADSSVFIKTSAPAGEWNVSTVHPAIYLTKATNVMFKVRQNKGSNLTINYKVVVSKY